MKVLSSLVTPTRVPAFLGWAAIFAGLLVSCKEDHMKIVGTVSIRPSLEITFPIPNFGEKYVTRAPFSVISGTCSENSNNLEAWVYPADEIFSWTEKIGTAISFIDADCSDKTWSALVDADTLTEGDNVFAIHALATSSNSSTYQLTGSLTITYDTVLNEFERTKPDTVSDEYYTIADTETISGTCDSDIIRIETTLGILEDDDCSDGTWSLAPYTFPAEGPAHFDITATDLAGNFKTIETIMYYDHTSPSIAITVPLVSPFRTKILPSISGTCSDAYGIYSIWADISGNEFMRDEYFACTEFDTWSFTPHALVYGHNITTVRARDFAFNTAATSVIIDFDNKPPNLAITGYPSTRRTKASPFTLSGTCGFVDNDTAVTLTTSRGTLVSASCIGSVWSLQPYDFHAVGDGDYNFNLTATDDLGNSISKNITLTYDTTPPAVTITNADNFRTNDASPTFTGTCDTIGTVNLRINDLYTTPCTSGQWSYTPPAQTSAGTYPFWIDASDDLANTLHKEISWTYDITPPVFDFILPVATSGLVTTINSEIAISGSCDTQVKSMHLTIDTERAFNLNCAAGTWALQAPYILRSGINTITINATDEAGNTSANKSISIEYDNVPPLINITSPSETGVFSTDLESIKISGLCGRENITLTLFVPNNPGYSFESNACSTEGTWILKSAYPLAMGLNTITIKAYDPNGNARPVTTLITRTAVVEGQSVSGHAYYSVVPDSAEEESRMPARAIVVAAVDENGSEVDSATTDGTGSFELKVPTGQSVNLVMKAIIPSPLISGQFFSVTDSEGSPVIYPATSIIIPAEPITDINLDVPLAEGAVPEAFSAPFVLLDSIYENHFVVHYSPNNNEINPEPEVEWIIPSPQSLADNESSFENVFGNTPFVSLGEGASIPSEASGPWLLHFEVEGDEGPIEKVLEMSLLP